MHAGEQAHSQVFHKLIQDTVVFVHRQNWQLFFQHHHAHELVSV
jgi:hypothetical protein